MSDRNTLIAYEGLVKKIIILSCILIFMPISVLAATINVPVDQATIQAGIDVSINGDTVLIADGTYTGVGNYNVDFNGKSITVQSVNGPDNCIIDCQSLGRGFLAYSGETVTLDGLTVKNGTAGNGNAGGGIYIYGASPSITNCVFANNNASANGDSGPADSEGGGGIYAKNSFGLAFTNCEFKGNSASAAGGAVYIVGGDASFNKCTLTMNETVDNRGGAVYVFNCDLAFINCTFTKNTSGMEGGAVYGSVSSFTNCTFIENYSSFCGGAVVSYSSQFAKCLFVGNGSGACGGAVEGYNSTFKDCIFTANTAISPGGAVYCRHTSFFTNCMFKDNGASNGGAVYFPSYSSSNMTNCTFTFNEATTQGGALWCDIPLTTEDPIVLKNCILWDNAALEGSETYEAEKSLMIACSDIQGGHTGEGNINTDPLFIDTDNDDLHLQYGSPCIDTGTADGAPEDDLDDYLRPIGAGYDMGVYEYHYDTLLWQGYSSCWSDSQNWQPDMIPVVFNVVLISILPNERDWPVINASNSVAEKVLIESGTLTVDQGRLSIGGF